MLDLSNNTMLKQLLFILLGRPLLVPLRTYRLARRIARGTVHEPELDLLTKLVRPGDAVIDIGANVGVYARALAPLVGDQGKLLAFEPLHENLAVLQKLAKLHALPRTEIVAAAVSDHAGHMTIHLPKAQGFEALYCASLVSEDGVEDQEARTVAVTTLDAESSQRTLPSVSVIKCDVEGGECGVFAGATELLRRDKPALLVEVAAAQWDGLIKIISPLGYLGYVLSKPESGRAALITNDRYRDHEYSNYFFLHPQSESFVRANAAKILL